MIDLEGMILDIRRANPRRDRTLISNYRDMLEYLKHVDLPDCFADLLRPMWDVIKNHAQEIQGRLSDPELSIEAYHELVVGYSVYEHCKKNSLQLLYSPKLNGKTPDWVVQDGEKQVIIEVVTSNKSDSHSAFDTCEGLIYVLIERGLNSKGINETLSFNTSRFNVPEEDAKGKEEKYTKFCYEVADRIVNGLKCGLGRKEWFCDDSGLEVQIGSGLSSRMTTSGYETFREINRILYKGQNYQSYLNSIP